MELKRCKKAPRPWQMRFGFEGPAFARRANAQPLGCIPGLALVRPFPAFKRKGTLLMLLLLLLLLLLLVLLLLLQQQQQLALLLSCQWARLDLSFETPVMAVGEVYWSRLVAAGTFV